MRFDEFSFGHLRIDGDTYERDVVIDGAEVRRRRKRPSKELRNAYGHTPLSEKEDIPWRCSRLVIGTGAAGALPVTDEVREEARRRSIELVIVPTAEAIKLLTVSTEGTNAVLHVTC
jgi:hypothetical protein